MSEKKISNDQARYFYVVLTEDLPVGAQSKHTPQHITLIPPFVADEQDVLDVAKETAIDFGPFDIELGEDAIFGPQKDIPVVLVKPSKKLDILHLELINKLKEKGIDIYKMYNNQFVDNQFTPHITLKKFHHEPDKSQAMTIDHIAVLRKLKNIKTIIAKESLGKSDEAQVR